jgi:hypothetical protein
MHDPETLSQILAAADQRRAERRQFLRSASVLGMAAGGSALLAACGAGNQNKAPTPTPTATGTATPTPTSTATTSYTTADVLSLALNLEYLEAQFFSQAAFGTALDSTLTVGATSTDTAGTVTGGRQVTFSDPTIAEFAREIATDEKGHVTFLRTSLSTSVVAQPALNIDGGATGAFTTAARAAGVVGSSSTFDPYASDTNFLLAAFFLEDVVVTAYRGLISYLATSTLVEATAGLQGSEAYHAGMIRSTLYAMGASDSTLITNAGKFSNYRDSLDGTTDDDQGIETDTNGASNIVPTDSNSIVYARTPQQVLNVLYLTAGTGVAKGGFFPSGVTGTITTTS